MIIHLLRSLTKPRRRWLVVLVFLAGFWTEWVISPQRPRRSFPLAELEVPENARIVGGGKSMFVESNGNTGTAGRKWSLIRLSNCEAIKQQVNGSRWGLSPDGLRLVFDDRDQLVMIDTESGDELFRIESFAMVRKVEFDKGSQIRFSADGSRFAAEGPDVAIFDTATGHVIARFGESTGPVDLSADGMTLATGLKEPPTGTAIWDVRTRRKTATLDDTMGEGICGLRLSPSLDLLLRQESPRYSPMPCDIWDISLRRRICRIGMMSDPEFSADGRFVVDRGWAYQGSTVDLAANSLGTHTTRIGKGLGSASRDGTRYLIDDLDGSWWFHDARTGAIISSGKRSGLNRFGMTPDGEMVIQSGVAAKGPMARLWHQLLAYLGVAKSRDYQTILYDAASGRQVASLPETFPVCINLADSTLWSTRYVKTGPLSFYLVMEEHSIRNQAPPVWLWLTTAVGIMIVGSDAWRWRLTK